MTAEVIKRIQKIIFNYFPTDNEGILLSITIYLERKL